MEKEHDDRKKAKKTQKRRSTVLQQLGSPQLESKEKLIDWSRKKAIYDMLSHHYILRRSVVFIVDTEYSSAIYQDMANDFIKKQFGKLDSEDYVGYISLGKDTQLD